MLDIPFYFPSFIYTHKEINNSFSVILGPKWYELDFLTFVVQLCSTEWTLIIQWFLSPSVEGKCINSKVKKKKKHFYGYFFSLLTFFYFFPGGILDSGNIDKQVQEH